MVYKVYNPNKSMVYNPNKSTHGSSWIYKKIWIHERFLLIMSRLGLELWMAQVSLPNGCRSNAAWATSQLGEFIELDIAMENDLFMGDLPL